MEEKKREKLTIVPTAFPEEPHVGIQKVSVTYVQSDDTNHRSDICDAQELTISTEDAIVSESDDLSNIGGYYLTIQTERWAINDENELVDLIEDFKSRVMNNWTQSEAKIKENEEGEEVGTDDLVPDSQEEVV